MARIMLTKDGVREITDGDRGILNRTDDLALLAEFSRQLLARFTERRAPRYGLSVIAIVVLAAATIAAFVLDAPRPVFVIALMLFVPAYVVNIRISRAETRRRKAFEAWFAAIGLRVEQIERGELHGDIAGDVTAVYEIAGLPAPAFVGKDIRIMTEADRLAILATTDVDALLAFQHQLGARRRAPGASPWLAEVTDRLVQLAARD